MKKEGGKAPMNCSELPHTKVFKLEHLLFTAEIFLNAPSGKVSQGYIYHVFFEFDFLLVASIMGCSVMP